MPAVRLLTSTRVDGEVRRKHAVVTVSGEAASTLLAEGRAELLRGEQPETPETRNVETPEG